MTIIFMNTKYYECLGSDHVNGRTVLALEQNPHQMTICDYGQFRKVY